MDEPRATLTVNETAELLGISYSSLVRAINRGDIPAIRIGHRTQIPRHFIEQLLAEGNTKAAS